MIVARGNMAKLDIELMKGASGDTSFWYRFVFCGYRMATYQYQGSSMVML